MQFIDRLTIFARGGRGGDGCVSFRREKYIEFGGPNGGSGGAGGSVFLKADSGLSTLLDLAAHPHCIGRDGTGGKGSDKTGAGGEDIVVRVPCGTMVFREGRLLADMTRPGQRVLIARGGRGGRGNAVFKSNANRAPRIREKGEPGEDVAINLELKLLADVGLVGFPNSGKSTFLAAVSNARPKIADYPFTTLSPHLGLVKHRGRSFILADIPGLIEGAHEGKGLGDEFLRHVERTRVLVHLIDPFGFGDFGPAATVRAIERELAGYSRELTKKPRLLAVTKMDLTDAEKVFKKLKARYRSRPLCAVSAVTGTGMKALLDAVVRLLPAPPSGGFSRRRAGDEPEGLAEGGAQMPGAPGDLPRSTPEFRVFKEGGQYVVAGEKIKRLEAMTDFGLPQAMHRFQGILKKMGVNKDLSRLGAEPGDTVRIGKREFEWMDESASPPPQTPARRRKSYRKERPVQE